MRRCRTIVALCLALATAFTAFAWAGDLPELKYEKYVLPNGLNVILHEDHSIPIVSVNIWYHVGSKNEKPGKTGFAHLFEHLMFQGSQNHNVLFAEGIAKIGGKTTARPPRIALNTGRTSPAIISKKLFGWKPTA